MSDVANADFLKLYQPTSDSLTPQVLLRTIKSTVSELFGDYGSGVIAGSIQGMDYAMTDMSCHD